MPLKNQLTNTNLRFGGEGGFQKIQSLKSSHFITTHLKYPHLLHPDSSLGVVNQTPKILLINFYRISNHLKRYIKMFRICEINNE